MNKKKALSLSLVVIMLAILSLSSLAWFSDSDEVTNKFHIATSDDPADPDDIFSVDVWEKVDIDGDGKVDDVKPGEDADGGSAEFRNILPGSKLTKEPVVENTGAYAQFIRVTVTLSDAEAWLEILGEGYKLDTIFLHMTDGVVAYDRSGAVIHCNSAASEMLLRPVEKCSYDELFEEIYPFRLVLAMRRPNFAEGQLLLPD